jgi:hypothetical protein
MSAVSCQGTTLHGGRDRRRVACVRRSAEIDLHQRDLVDELDLAEVLDLGVDADDLDPRQTLAGERSRAGDGRIAPVPARGEGVGIDEVGRRHLDPVVELRQQHAVGHLRRRRRAAPDGLERARRVGEHGVGGDLGFRRLDGEGLDAIRKPRAASRRRHQRGITDRGPHQASGLIGKAGHRVPRGLSARRRADGEPAVPGKVLQLDRPDEDRGGQTGLRVVRDVLHALRILRAERLTPQRVADGHALAPAREQGDEAALELQALEGILVRAAGAAGVSVLSGAARRGIAQSVGVDEIRLVPAFLHPRRCGAIGQARGEVDLLQRRIRLAGRGLEPPRSGEDASEPSRRSDPGRPGGGSLHSGPRRFDQIEVCEEIVVVGRDRVRMGDELGRRGEALLYLRGGGTAG